MWEDGKNSAGGRWLLQLPAAKNNQNIDEYWKNIVRDKLFYLIFIYEYCCMSIVTFRY